MLNWTRKDLAAAAKISVGTVEKIEAGNGYVMVGTEILLKLHKAFKAAGISFWDDPRANAEGVFWSRDEMGQVVQNIRNIDFQIE